LRLVDLRENYIAKDVWRTLTDQLERAAPEATVML
jgi:hypothetical protein